MIKGVIFDMDGVLVDSEGFICRAAIEMFRNMGVTVKAEDFRPYIGAGENRYLGGVAEKYKVSLNIEKSKRETYSIYLDLIKGQLKALPGVQEFIQVCRSAGLKTAIATSADYVKMNANLKEIGLPPESFDATINGLMVERKKPFPDIYKLAASSIGLPPEQCLVVEDAVNGVQAAKAAGSPCLALETSFPAEQMREADWIIPDLSSYRDIIDKIFD